MFMCAALAGCDGSVPVNRDALAGGYIYKSESPETRITDHNLDYLSLNPDGTYRFVQGGSTRPKIVTQGNWKLWSGGDQGTQLLLDQSSYPVRIEGGKIKLLIDNDVGIWLAKVK